jgi:translation initiation factor 3 subunit L
MRARAGGHERFYASEGYDGGSNVLRMIGYFSLTGLLRVHTLVGDYGGALASLAVVHPFQRSNLFTPKIAGVQLKKNPRSLRADKHEEDS